MIKQYSQENIWIFVVLFGVFIQFGVFALSGLSVLKKHAFHEKDKSLVSKKNVSSLEYRSWEYAGLYSEVEPISQMIKKRVSKHLRKKSKQLAMHILFLCRKYRFDPAFVLSVIATESSFRHKIISYAGAIGLMQLMPRTAKFVSRLFNLPYKRKRDLKNPFLNLSLGVAYLSFLRKKYAYRHRVVLAAYNMGPGRVDHLLAKKHFLLKTTLPYVFSVLHRAKYFRRNIAANES